MSAFRSHLGKDFRLEWRSRDALNAIPVFLSPRRSDLQLCLRSHRRRIAAHCRWHYLGCISVRVLSLLSTQKLESRIFPQPSVLDALRLTPAPAESLFLAKACSNFFFVLVTELLIAPVFVMFYNLHALGRPVLLIPTLLLGTWALVVNGTFFAALSLRLRSREVMLPLILFPISLPALLLAMVEATTAILTGAESPSMWLNILASYDIVFTAVGVMLFEPVLNAE